MTRRFDQQATRRSILRAGVAAVGGATGTVIAATRAKAQEKIAQKMVQYQDTPKNDQKCSLCVQFDPPGACKIVAGKIDANGWCIAFAPKTP